ncbi:hypothetical protein BH09PLA1_BH09PLA1_13640 [soil metagenome]
MKPSTRRTGVGLSAQIGARSWAPILALVCAAWIPTATCIAQPDPAAAPAPATAPASVPVPPRYVMTVPPGFHKVESGYRAAICEDVDDAWVRKALDEVAPTTMPTTMPGDVVDRLNERRDILKARIAGDLSLKDLKLIDALIDNTLIPQAKKLNELQPPIFYLVATRDRIKQVLKAGWTDPHFRYNRVNDDVNFNPDLRLTDERPMDDMVMPVIYAPDATAEAKRKNLEQMMQRNEASVVDAFSRRAQLLVQLSIIEFIQKEAIDPLNLKGDQQWLGLGMQAVLSAKYMHDLLGISQDDLLSRMTRDDPRNPIRPDAVDLLHPADRTQMKREWVPLYGDAFRVKSARVVRAWSEKCGESAISTTLAAMRASPPADGPALVKLITVTTGVDLTNEVKAR